MDKGLTVPKWLLIVWPKIPPTPQNLSAQFVCPIPKVLNLNEKRLHWASVVCGNEDYFTFTMQYVQCLLENILPIFKTKKWHRVSHHPNVTTPAVVVRLGPGSVLITNSEDFIGRTISVRC